MLAIVILLGFSFEATTIAASMAINCRGRSGPQPQARNAEEDEEERSFFDLREETLQRRGKKVETLIAGKRSRSL
jgi:hypothetical protein